MTRWSAHIPKAFSLFELFLVLTLLSGLALFFGINIRAAKEKELFLTESEAILGRLRLAQYLMLMAKSDTKISFTSEHQKIKCFVHTSSIPSPKFNKGIEDLSCVFSSIEKIEFQEEKPLPDFSNSDSSTTNLYFFSDGFVMSCGTLYLYPKKQEQPPRLIYLSGYPEPLTIKTSLNLTFPNRDFFYQQVALATFQEITPLTLEKK